MKGGQYVNGIDDGRMVVGKRVTWQICHLSFLQHEQKLGRNIPSNFTSLSGMQRHYATGRHAQGLLLLVTRSM